MNKRIAIILLAIVPLAAQTVAKKKSKAPAAPVAQPLVIPKTASANADGTFSFTDKSGKKWIYSKTPFGVSKTEDMSGAAPVMAAAPAGQYVKAFDNGETVRFERQSPFGTTKWEKKKTELTDEERAVVERQSAAPAVTKQ